MLLKTAKIVALVPYKIWVDVLLRIGRLPFRPGRIHVNLIDAIYASERRRNLPVVSQVMDLTFTQELDFIVEEERAFPGDQEFRKSGYTHTMLKRYFFSGKYFCDGKEILDSCSGIGWGTCILSKYAKSITAYDIDERAVEFASSYWKVKNVDWRTGDALNHDFLDGKLFDVVLAMETIEHFSRADAERYIRNIADSVKEQGYLIGSSAFPKTREQADALCSTNPYHLFIFTEKEILLLLKTYFRKVSLINRWMFIAQK